MCTSPRTTPCSPRFGTASNWLTDPYKRSYQRRQRRYVDRWRACLSRRYPHRSAEEISTAIRAIHALMLSDATRPIRSRSGDRAEDLLIGMTMRSLSELED